jgi:hypothetical protein
MPRGGRLSPPMSDGEFLERCHILARTDHARFPREIVWYLYELAGHKLSGNLPHFMVVRPPIADPLIAAARERLRRERTGDPHEART